MNVRHMLIVTLLCLASSVPTMARAAGEEKTESRTINTSGDSVIYVVPDEVIVGFGIETFQAQLDAAREANDAASKKLVAAVKAAGIEERYIQTDDLSLQIRYRDGGPANGIEGYIARRSFSVRIKDVKKLQAVIDAGLKNGGNQLMGVDYRTTELRKHRDDARKMAIKAAKEKAEALAAELSCKIGAPRTISEGYMGWAYSGGNWGRYGGGNYQAQNSIQEAPAAGDAGGDEGASPLGQIGVRAQVSVVFDLLPQDK